STLSVVPSASALRFCCSISRVPECYFFVFCRRQPPRSPLFPYTTLFRSQVLGRERYAIRERDVHGLGRAIDHGFPNLRAAKAVQDRKSTRLNSSHGSISYAVFCLKKKRHQQEDRALASRNVGQERASLAA